MNDIRQGRGISMPFLCGQFSIGIMQRRMRKRPFSYLGQKKKNQKRGIFQGYLFVAALHQSRQKVRCMSEEPNAVLKKQLEFAEGREAMAYT